MAKERALQRFDDVLSRSQPFLDVIMPYAISKITSGDADGPIETAIVVETAEEALKALKLLPAENIIITDRITVEAVARSELEQRLRSE